MKAMWTTVAFVGLLMACSGGTGPVVVAEPGPGPDDSPAPSPGEGAEQIKAPPGGSFREQAIRKLEDECKLGSIVQIALGDDTTERTNDSDSDMYSECTAVCVLDSACEDIQDRDQDHNSYRDCIADCSQ